MGKKSRPTSGQQSPAAPVPLKADPPPQPPAPVRSGGDEKAIGAQVDALLDQAEQQVRTMTELVNDSAPEQSPRDAAEKTAQEPAAPESASPESQQESTPAEAGEPEQPQPALDGPVDPEALQSQVDAILAEAGHHTGPTLATPSDDPDENLETEIDAGSDRDTETAIQTGAPQNDASPAPGSDSTDEAAADEQDDDPLNDPPQIDLAAVDAVIADAAQRAMEEDDFEVGSARGIGDDQTIDPPVTSPAPTAAANAADPAPPPAPKRKLVVKGGDASMRRDKSKRRRPSVSDLDGHPSAASVEERDSIESDDPQPHTSVEDEQPEVRLRARVARFTFRQMAAMNAPWHSWTVQTRYAVLGITFLNIALAAVAYFILLRRWI